MKSTSHTESETKKAVQDSKMLSMDQIAEIMGVHRTTISRRSKDEGWEWRQVQVRGGWRNVISLSDLPSDIQREAAVRSGELPAELADGVSMAWDKDKIPRSIKEWAAAADWQQELARKRESAVKAFQSRLAAKGTSSIGKIRILEGFVKDFNSWRVLKLHPDIYESIKHLCPRTLRTWLKAYEDGRISGLLPDYGRKKNKIYILEEQGNFILAIMRKHPDCNAEHIRTMLKNKFGESAAGVWSVRRFMKKEKNRDPTAWSFIENPDEYKSKYQLSLGNASEQATHFLHYVEVDSTPGDVLCNDNKRYNICGLIDQYSRCVRFVVSPTSNSSAIAGLLWSVCKDWGIPEHLIRDNGQDYASKDLNENLAILGCSVQALPPFTPEGKPHIERMFRTLLHGLFPLLSGYVGHNVAERKAIEARKSFADRLMKRGQTAEIGLSPAELQEIIDKWTENRYHQRRHSSLKMSPNAKRSQSTLDHLPRKIEHPGVLELAFAPKKDCKVTKNGMRFENGYYWDDPATMATAPGSLIEWNGKRVLVAVDMNDAGHLVCFDPKTKAFICHARDMAISGITKGEMIAAKKHVNKVVRGRANALMTIAKGFGDPVAEELDRIRTERPALTNLPVGNAITNNAFLKACYQVAGVSPVGATAGHPDDGRTPCAPTTDVGQAFQPAEDQICLTAEEDNPKVVRLPLPEREEVDLSCVTNPITVFEQLRMAQRKRPLTEREVTWLQRTVKSWGIHAHMTIEAMSQSDRNWLAKIVPDKFVQYGEPKRRYFRNSTEMLDYYRGEQRKRRLTAQEEKQVRNNARREDGQGWLSYAAQNWHAWDSEEQEWILRMVPDHLLDDFEAEKLEERQFGPRHGGTYR